jgi:hypothetical protein
VLGEREPQLLLPLAMGLPLVVAMALVGVRGEVATEVIALVLAVTVVVGGLIAGRAGGFGAALIAAASFDFFYTRPYLSLKIGNGNDLATTALLVGVGLLVGAMAQRGRRRQSAFGQDSSALLRVLQVAAEGCAEDVELSIRAELLRLLELQDCSFSREPMTLTMIDPMGRIRISDRAALAGDAMLPLEGVAIPVMWGDSSYGHLVAVPIAGRVTSASARRVAVAMAQTLGLSLAAEPAPA